MGSNPHLHPLLAPFLPSERGWSGCDFSFTFTYTADRNDSAGVGAEGPRGGRHVPISLTTTDGGTPFTFTVTLDVIVR